MARLSLIKTLVMVLLSQSQKGFEIARGDGVIAINTSTFLRSISIDLAVKARVGLRRLERRLEGSLAGLFLACRRFWAVIRLQEQGT